MATKRAKIINPTDLKGILAFLDARSLSPEADKLKVLLSYRAGMRVSEISRLSLRDVTTPHGKLGNAIRIFSHVGKFGKEREIPMHRDIAQAITRFREVYPDAERFAISSLGRYQDPNALTVWFHRLYHKLGFQGCSSHSGRRTFVTQLARRVEAHGGSLRDVQLLAGHARLDTTQAYIEPSHRSRDMINSLGEPEFDEQDRIEFLDNRQVRQVIEQDDSWRPTGRKTSSVRRAPLRRQVP